MPDNKGENRLAFRELRDKGDKAPGLVDRVPVAGDIAVPGNLLTKQTDLGYRRRNFLRLVEAKALDSILGSVATGSSRSTSYTRGGVSNFALIGDGRVVIVDIHLIGRMGDALNKLGRNMHQGHFAETHGNLDILAVTFNGSSGRLMHESYDDLGCKSSNSYRVTFFIRSHKLVLETLERTSKGNASQFTVLLSNRQDLGH